MKKLLLTLFVTLFVAGCGSTANDPTPLPGETVDSGVDTGTPADTAVVVEDTAPGETPVLPDDDLGAARAFVGKLGIGANIERGWAWSMPGQAATTSTKYWEYLRKELKVTHVRLFYPWRPTVAMGGGGPGNSPPDEAAFGRILDASDQAIRAGLVVFLDCTDVMGIEDFTDGDGDKTREHMRHCAEWTAKRAFDPKMFALGPVNEWAGGDDNTLFNNLRKEYHAVLRAELPGYVLTTGPAYWKSRDFLYDESKKFEVFDDLRVVYDWHHYSSLDAVGWKAEAKKLEGWRAAHGGRPTVCGEAGVGYWDEPVAGGTLSQRPESWPTRFKDQLGNIAAERPMLWAITYGGEFRLNKSGDDPYIMDGSDGHPDLVKVFRDGAAAIAEASK